MRRSLAGMLFVVAAVLLALAGGGWWLQRVAFDTSRSDDVAAAVLRDDAVRQQVTQAIADAAAGSVGMRRGELIAVLDEQAQTAAGAAVMAQIVADSHARLIGERDEPVQITGEQMVQVLRTERAADLPPITLPVEEVGVLSAVRTGLGWFVPVVAITGTVALLLGLLAHPRKADAASGIGVFCLVAAVAVIGIGWALPVFVVPLVSDEPWLAVIPAVADQALPILLGGAILLVALGVFLLAAGAAARRRKLWSAPVSVGRYGDQHRWS